MLLRYAYLLFPGKWFFIDPLSSYLWESHKKAIPKFLVLWAMASSPLLIGLLLQPNGASENSIQSPSFALSEFFPPAEQLVYAAAFLPSLIYLVFERLIDAKREPAPSKYFVNLEIRSLFRGYVFVAVVAVLVLVLAIIIYTAGRTNFEYLRNTPLYIIARNGAIYVYMYGLYCWYLTIIDAVQSPSDYVANSAESERNMVNKFNSRIEKRE